MLARTPVPCREIYDIVVVPTGVIGAVRRPARLSRRATGARSLDALGSVPTAELRASPSTTRARVSCDSPPHSTPTRWNAAVEIENTNVALRVSAKPCVACWTDEQGTQFDGMPLPVTLQPGHRTIVALPMAAPPPGVYRLTVSLVREGEYWFDDVDRGYGAAQRASVTPGPAH